MGKFKIFDGIFQLGDHQAQARLRFSRLAGQAERVLYWLLPEIESSLSLPGQPGVPEIGGHQAEKCHP